MALRRPTNKQSFSSIAGVGEAKLQEYSNVWTAAIAAYCIERPELAGKTYVQFLFV